MLSLAFQQLDGFPHSIEQPEALAGWIGRAMGWPQVLRYAGRLDGNYLFVSDADEHVTRVLLTTRYQISIDATARATGDHCRTGQPGTIDRSRR